MKSLSNDVRFLVLATALVALLGVQTFADLIRDDIPPRDVATASVGPRGPASTPKIVEVPAALAWREPLVEWACDQAAPKPFAIQGRHLQLKGKACGTDFKMERLTIVNETNGFTASVFEKSKSNFETDLIQLREGSNRVRVTYRVSPSKVVETVYDITSSSN